MTPEEINRLPLKRYGGPVYLVRTEHELDAAIRRLKRETVLGFDTETRPSFTKGRTYLPALIQLACADAVYLFQLSHLKFPAPLRELLAARSIVKAGVAIDRDVKELKKLGRFQEANFVDLGGIAQHAGIQNHGLRGLVALFLGFRISKQAQRSNWGRRDLSPAQVKYAATDAWSSRELYLRLKEAGYLKAIRQQQKAAAPKETRAAGPKHIEPQKDVRELNAAQQTGPEARP